MISYIKLIKILLTARKEKEVILFTFSAYQINILNYLIKYEKFYKNKIFLVFDFNKTEVGKLQVRKLCASNTKNYLGSVNLLKLVIITLISNFKEIRIIHGYLYGKSFKLLSFICKNKLCGLEDGSNTSLMPLIINTKFLEFYTIFPSLKNSKRITEICEVKYLPYPKQNKISFSTIKKPTKAYICGSALVENKFISSKSYIEYLENLLKYLRLDNIKDFSYYPHRKEGKLKLEKIKNKLVNFKFNIIKPKIPFDQYLNKVKKNSLIITNNSTLERSILYQNIDLSKFNLLPTRFDPFYLKNNFNLKYLILSSTLAYGFNRKNLLLYSNKKFFNYDQILNEKKIFDYYFKKIESNYIRNIINVKNSKINFENWVGHPLIYNEKLDEFFIWRNISNSKSIIRYCKLSPTTIVGKHIID